MSLLLVITVWNSANFRCIGKYSENLFQVLSIDEIIFILTCIGQKLLRFEYEYFVTISINLGLYDLYHVDQFDLQQEHIFFWDKEKRTVKRVVFSVNWNKILGRFE